MGFLEGRNEVLGAVEIDIKLDAESFLEELGVHPLEFWIFWIIYEVKINDILDLFNFFG